MTLAEVDEASRIISQAVDPDARIIFGSIIDNRLGDKIVVTVIATGFASMEDSNTIISEEEEQEYPQYNNSSSYDNSYQSSGYMQNSQQSDYGKSDDYDQPTLTFRDRFLSGRKK